MASVTLQEISRRTIRLNKIFETAVHWHNTPLSVLTDKGLYLLDFSYNILCFDKKIDMLEYSLLCATTSPATKLFPPGFTKNEIRSIKYNQMLIDPVLWPHDPDLMKELTNFVSFSWSPPDFKYNTECVLATVTNTGNMEFFGRQRLYWKSILKLSDEIEAVYDFQTLKFDKKATLEQMRQSAMTVETGAFCWGTSCGNDSVYFVTAQKNGDLLFWSLTIDNPVTAKFISKITTDISLEIVSINWVPQTDKTFLIIYSNNLGQVYALKFEINNDTMCLNNSNCLWSHKDRMITKHLKYSVIDKKLVLLYVKHRHLIVQVLDSNYNIQSQCFENINENRITSLTTSGNYYYLCTVNCRIYKIYVKLSNDMVSIESKPIFLKDNYSTYELYGFSISNNGNIFSLALVDRRVMYRKEPLRVSVIFAIEEDKQTEVTNLINNPCKNISQMWDCIELIRCKSVKTKTLPNIDFHEFYAKCETDAYKLKVYLIFLLLYKNHKEAMWLYTNVTFPETSIEKVKAKIEFIHAQNVLDKLFKSYQLNGQKLSEFELEMYVSVKRYLELYSQKYNCNLADFIDVDKFDIVKNRNIEQICDHCDENLVGLSCKNGHVNMFCSISFTQIKSEDYIFCPKCSTIARIELKTLKPNCIFCDHGLCEF